MAAPVRMDGHRGHTAVPISIDGWDALCMIDHDRDITVTVVPQLAMLVWSLTADGRELVAQPNTLADVADTWVTTGIPLLYPWANRLDGDRLRGVPCPALRRAGVPRDENDLPIHGLNLGGGWTVDEPVAGPEAATIAATRRFDGDLLEVYPYPHELGVRMTLTGGELVVETWIDANQGVAVPIAFGWHPYFQLPDVPRREWTVRVPVRSRAELDAQMIPTGRVVPVAIPDAALGDVEYDDLFPDLDPSPTFRLASGGRGIAITFGAGYTHAQVYAPRHRDLIAFEPMTALTNALNGADVATVRADERFVATFRVRPIGAG